MLQKSLRIQIIRIHLIRITIIHLIRITIIHLIRITIIHLTRITIIHLIKIIRIHLIRIIVIHLYQNKNNSYNRNNPSSPLRNELPFTSNNNSSSSTYSSSTRQPYASGRERYNKNENTKRSQSPEFKPSSNFIPVVAPKLLATFGIPKLY